MKETMTLADAVKAGMFGPTKKARVRKRPTAPKIPRAAAESRCVNHDESFTTDATEDRHVNAHHGCRIETVLT